MKHRIKRRLFAVLTALVITVSMLPRGTLALGDESPDPGESPPAERIEASDTGEETAAESTEETLPEDPGTGDGAGESLPEEAAVTESREETAAEDLTVPENPAELETTEESPQTVSEETSAEDGTPSESEEDQSSAETTVFSDDESTEEESTVGITKVESTVGITEEETNVSEETTTEDPAAEGNDVSEEETGTSEEQKEEAPLFKEIAEDSLLTESQLSALDFSSKRLLLAGAEIIDQEHVLSEYDGIVLLQYEDEITAKYAYSYYYGKAAFVTPDSVISIAEGNGDAGALGREEMTQDRNPLNELSEAVSENSTVYSGPVVALIDTGVNESAHIAEAVSMIGRSSGDDNGHGTEMAKLIAEQNPDVRILSIKAFGADGTADVSAVYAAFRYAMEKNAPIINLSAAVLRKTENEVIASVIGEAVSKGIKVVGAAGNYGSDAKYFVPGSVESANIIGAAEENGLRRPNSNYGKTVDFNVRADSTSKAAAIYSGLLSAGKGGIDMELVFPTEDDPLYQTIPGGPEEFTVQVDRNPAVPARYEQQLAEGVYRYDAGYSTPLYDDKPEFGDILAYIIKRKFAETYGWNYSVRAEFEYNGSGRLIETTVPSLADAVTYDWNWKSAKSIDGSGTANNIAVFMNHIWKSSPDPSNADPVYCYDYAASDLGARTEKKPSDIGLDQEKLSKAYRVAANLSANHFTLLKANLSSFFNDYHFSSRELGVQMWHDGVPVDVNITIPASELAEKFAADAASAGDDPYQTIVQYIVWYIMNEAELMDRNQMMYAGAAIVEGKEGPAYSPADYWVDNGSDIISPEALIGIGEGNGEKYTIPKVSQGNTGPIEHPGSVGGQLLILTVLQSGHAKVIKTSKDTEISDGGRYSFEGIRYAFYTDAQCMTLAKIFGTEDDAIVTLDANGESGTIELETGKDGTTYWVREYSNPSSSNYETGTEIDSAVITPGELQIYRESDNPIPGQIGVVKKYTGGDTVSLTGAVYGLYASQADAKSGRNALSTVTISQSDITNGTSSLKIFDKKLTIGKTYFVREISVSPASISVDPNVYGKTAGREITASVAASVAVSEDRLNNGFMRVKKVSENPEISDGNSCYSLKDIEFRVYTSEACTEEAVNAAGSPIILKTDENGLTQSVEMILGDYWVKEVEASVKGKGWTVNGTPVKVTVSASNTAGNTAEITIRNTANGDPIGILLKKADDGRGTEGGRVAF